MQLRTRTWFLLSLLFFAGSVFFWLKGNDYQSHKQGAPRPATNSAALPPRPHPPIAKALPARSEPFAYRLSNTTKTISQLARAEDALLLRNALIDAAGKPLEIPEHLRSHGDPGAYIVQSKSAPSPSFREFLLRAHAEIVSYIPNNAYLIKASPDALADLQAGPEVRAVLPFEPYYKLDQRLLGAAVQQSGLPDGTVLRVLLYPGDEQVGRTGLESLGGEIVGQERSPFGSQYLVRVQPGSLVALAQLSTVQEIEPFRQRVPANDLTRVQVGISTNTTTAANYMNLTGTNIYININDSGVDSTHPDFTVANVLSPVPSALTDTNGHGTHVAGILSGSGKQSKSVKKTPDGSVTNASFRGMAPGAKLLVLPIDFSPSGDYIGAAQKHVTDTYLQETAITSLDKYNRTNDTLISNNSWTYSGTSEYDTSAARYDAAVRDALPERPGSQPIIYVFAAGNGGFGDDDGLGGVPDSIFSPGTAKNVITVGSLEHLRFLTNQYVTTNFTLSASNTTLTNYTTNMPFLTITDNDNEVANYSSRGNVGIGTEGDFGRFKPDVVAPGTFIVSTKATNWTLASQLATNSLLYPLLSNLDSNLAPYYRYDSGTTFAAPVVSGMLALIQEFYGQHVPGRKRSLSPALMKAIIINGAHSVNPQYDLQVQNSVNHQGWGLANLQQILPPIMATGAESTWPIQLIEQSPTNAVATGQSKTWAFTLSTNASAPLRITLVWTDPPGNPNAGIKLVNDLDLVVTNVETGAVFYGNNIPSGSDFTSASDTNAPPQNDLVNNVENVFITDPQSIGKKFTVSVIGRRVNVNALSDYLSLTGKTNDVVQDFALVIASGSITVTNAIQNLSPAAVSGQFNASFVTTITNGLPLLNQRVGANASLVVTNGITNQWSFFVFTNTFNTNTSDLFSLTNGTNVAFVTYLPPNLSRQRNFEADLDMYVSSDARLLNLDPNVLAGAKRSVGRTGTELVVYSNAAPNQIFYVGIKSEDQQGAEFGFITISTDQPFETTSGNNRVLRVFPGNKVVPDGSANLPGAAVGIAVGLTPSLIQRATARTTIAHEDLGDLIGTVYHRRHSVVLNNHTANNGAFSGTNIFSFNDSSILSPGDQHTDGPGSLNDFVGDASSGPWIFQLVDNSPTHVGRLQDMVITIQPFVGGDLSKAGSKVFTVSTDPICFFVDVPPNATNMIVTLVGTNGTTDVGNLEMLIQKDLIPGGTNYQKRVVGNPIITLPLGLGDKPPLSWGRYYVCVSKINTNLPNVNFTINLDLKLAFEPDLFGSFGSSNPQNLVEDTVTTNTTFTVLADRDVANVEVGVRINHPRVSDLVLHLKSAQGTRILLAENRGGTSTNGYGSGTGDNLAYAIFTENTNLAPIPIKFAVPPFGSTNAVLNSVLTNSFDSAAGGVYFPTEIVDGWTVVGNDVTIAAKTGFAVDGGNFAALCDSGITRTFATVPGKQYILRFQSRAPMRLFGTGVDDKGQVLPDYHIDPHYDISLTAFTPNTIFRPTYVAPAPLTAGWLANSGTSAWIEFVPSAPTSQQQQPGTYIYRTLFDLCGFDPATAKITGKWTADDRGVDILVNGKSALLGTAGPGSFSNPFTLAAGAFNFNETVNTLDFVTTNAITSAIGLRTEVALAATPLSTFTNAGSSGLVKLTGILSNSFGGTAYWTNNSITFVATTNSTFLEIDAAQSGMWIDGVSVRESGNRYFQPEEDLSILQGERATGEWALEIWDSRVGATVTNATQLLSWTVNLDFALPQIPAIILTNGIPYRGTITTNEIQYFIVETCPGTTIAKNVLSGASGGLELLGNRGAIPTEDPERDDYVPVLNNEKGTGTNDTATLTLKTTTPPAAPLIPGKRYFLAVRNANTLQTNSFTLTTTLDVSGCSSSVSSLSVASLTTNAPVIASVRGGGQANYVFSVPASSALAVFELNGLNGNADLLLRRGSPPTPQAYDRISANFGADAEQIVISTNSLITSLAGDWYLAVVNNDPLEVDYTIHAAAYASSGTSAVQLQTPTYSRDTGIITLTWSSVAGSRYAIEGSSDLVTWTPLTDITATGAEASFGVATDPAAKMQFYRIRAE